MLEKTGKLTRSAMDLDVAEGRVAEWEDGLPRMEELTPLSQTLIPLTLASAFSVTPEPRCQMADVNHASHKTMAKLKLGCLLGVGSAPGSSKQLNSFSNEDENGAIDGEFDSPVEDENCRKRRASESGFLSENSNCDQSGRPLKRARLVWTPQLHKRFVDVVSHLGIKNAVPKTIMQLMNVEGLTRENVVSHLQKYRLYLKRMRGFPGEDLSSSSDLFFAFAPPPNAFTDPAFMSGAFFAGVAKQGHAPPAMHSGGIVAGGPYNMFEAPTHVGCVRKLVPQRMSGGEQRRDWAYDRI